MGDWLPVEQSLIKDIKKLYTKSIMWTVIWTIITIVAFFITLVVLQREMIPANYAENVAVEASTEMKRNASIYLDKQAFSAKQNELQKKGVFLSEFSLNGEMISGPETFTSLLKKEEIPEYLNTNLNKHGYYHLVIPKNAEGEIKGVWVYSYKLKANFAHEYYRYIMIGMFFLIFLSPIIYFIIFSKFYINKLYKSIKQPLDELMIASHKISQKDLDFDLNYNFENEIGQLINSFRQMQRELKNSLYENWKKDSEWAVMMSSLSHDLKTPITLIGMGSEMLENDPSLSEEQKKNVEIIARNIAKANRLLVNMNIAGSIKNPTVIKEMTTLSGLISEIESDFKPLIKDKSINYSRKITANMNSTVPYLKMSRVLQNIFSNAVQYTTNGGEIIFTVNQSDNQLLFALENSGEGINKENWENIFKKHFREDQSRSTVYGNSGLGLYIAKQLMQSIGGTIVITEPVNLIGVRFEIILPIDIEG